MAIYPHPNLPSYLYKYTSTVSGKAILENGTLRFSRPSCFNDGFDLRINLEIEADSNRAITEIINNLWESANNTTVSFANNDLGNLLRSLRNFRWAAERYPDFVEFMRPTVKMQVDNRTESLRKFNDSVVKECAYRKVFCLSETPISAPLWGNYAENLSGMVLKFSPTLDIDSLFLLAKPIKYVQGAPQLFTHKEFVEWMSGRINIDADAIHDLFLYTKSDDWSYEKEWRIVAGNGWIPDQAVEDVKFDRRDLHSVIFGTKTPSEFREHISKIVKNRYPNCKIQSLVVPKSGIRYEIVDA